MKKSNFYYLEGEFPKLYEYGTNAEKSFYDNDKNFPVNIRLFLENLCCQVLYLNKIEINCSNLSGYYKLIKKYNIFDSECINVLYNLKNYTNQSHHDSSIINHDIDIEINMNNNRIALNNVWVISQIFYDKYSKEHKYNIENDEFELPSKEDSKIYKDDKIQKQNKEIEDYKKKEIEYNKEIVELKRRINQIRDARSGEIDDALLMSDIVDIFMENDNKPLKAKYVAMRLISKYPSIDKHYITRKIFYGASWKKFFMNVNNNGEYIINFDISDEL